MARNRAEKEGLLQLSRNVPFNRFWCQMRAVKLQAVPGDARTCVHVLREALHHFNETGVH